MAEMAWNQGDDLYSYANDRLLLGLEYNMRYSVPSIQSYPDQLNPWVPTVASGEFIQRFDRTGRWYSKAISPSGAGDYRTLFLTLPSASANYKRLQVDNSGVVKMVSTASAGTWESFPITEALGVNTIEIQENQTGYCSVEGTLYSNHTRYTETGFVNTVNSNGR